VYWRLSGAEPWSCFDVGISRRQNQARRNPCLCREIAKELAIEVAVQHALASAGQRGTGVLHFGDVLREQAGRAMKIQHLLVVFV